ncbi:hypothetical protein AAL_00821 [Moelleriella libera RCEF 2490]|uniref:Uncharacterized protein n=1 Tax=Moelleriella libera RCEF 2490 TaxID=1081109 RepID=A0A166V7I8_9HYPO|nr:hypothetical protein AAL_00821 [Moelleriella libera RCEF 2490]
MKFFALAALFTIAVAAPAELEKRQTPCGDSVYSIPKCCTSKVFSLACLQSQNPRMLKTKVFRSPRSLTWTR